MKKIALLSILFLTSLSAICQSVPARISTYKADKGTTININSLFAVSNANMYSAYSDLSDIVGIVNDSVRANSVNVTTFQGQLPMSIYTGTITPVNHKSAIVGSLYVDRADSTIWIKLVGTDSAGWYSVRQK